MKEIPLTRGKVALVDDEDYEYLMQWKWGATQHNNPYAVRYETIPQENRKSTRRQRIVYMHRLVTKNIGKVDHINRNGLDNRRSNLRPATQTQNVINRPKRIGTSSKYIGVYYFKRRGKWGAGVRVNHQRTHIGWFLSETEAAKARDQVAREKHGEFAVLNFPEDYT